MQTYYLIKSTMFAGFSQGSIVVGSDIKLYITSIFNFKRETSLVIPVA